jgi:hypothetical protein
VALRLCIVMRGCFFAVVVVEEALRAPCSCVWLFFRSDLVLCGCRRLFPCGCLLVGLFFRLENL